MIEVIRRRVSRRNYIDKQLEIEDANLINDLIKQVNFESGLSIELVLDAKKAFDGLNKSYGLFKNVNSVIVLKGPKSENLLELCGYYGEKIVLEATKNNFGTCFVGGSFDKKFFNNINDEIVCLITIGYVSEKLSTREKFVHKALHTKQIDILDIVKYHHEISNLEMEAIEAVKLAPSAKNRRVIRLDYVEEQVVISTANTYHFDMFDLGIAKYNYEYITNIKFPLGNNARINYKK